jgi:hypothetical protein
MELCLKPDGFHTGRRPDKKTAKGDVPDTQRTCTRGDMPPGAHARYMLPVGIGGFPAGRRCPRRQAPWMTVKSAALTRARANPVQTSHQGAITAPKTASTRPNRPG